MNRLFAAIGLRIARSLQLEPELAGNKQGKSEKFLVVGDRAVQTLRF